MGVALFETGKKKEKIVTLFATREKIFTATFTATDFAQENDYDRRIYAAKILQDFHKKRSRNFREKITRKVRAKLSEFFHIVLYLFMMRNFVRYTRTGSE